MMKPKRPPPYKGLQGQWLTQSLFKRGDHWLSPENRADEPVFSLDEDIEGLINAHTTFVALEDPTGYKWAMRYLGSWEHFERLQGVPWFAKSLSQWRGEISAKQRSDAIENITLLAREPGAVGLSAAKYLAERGWDKPTKGRPSKSDIDRELKRHTQILEQESDDMKRIGLKLVSG